MNAVSANEGTLPLKGKKRDQIGSWPQPHTDQGS